MFTEEICQIILEKSLFIIADCMNLLQSKLEEKQPISPEVPKTILDR